MNGLDELWAACGFPVAGRGRWGDGCNVAVVAIAFPGRILVNCEQNCEFLK
jgi:hypothetical protein